MNSSSDSISVIVPVYNRGEAVARTIESVLRQTHAPLEIIVVNDGSTDDTHAVLERICNPHPQIYLFHTSNGGVARARNFGLEQARGDWIAFLDHDDLWHPQKLEKQLAAASAPVSHSASAFLSVGVVHCDWRAVDEAGTPMPRLFQLSQQEWWHGARGRVYPWILMPHFSQFLRNPVISMSVPLVRADVLRAVGGFDPELVPSDDWDLWIRLAQRTRWEFVPEVLVDYVHHEAQQHVEMDAAYRSWVRLCRKHPVEVRRFPLVWLKQRLFLRYCRAFECLRPAQEAAEQGARSKVVLWSLRALWQRPDMVLTRRWRRLWRQSLIS